MSGSDGLIERYGQGYFVERILMHVAFQLVSQSLTINREGDGCILVGVQFDK